jgi:hypothetical protein
MVSKANVREDISNATFQVGGYTASATAGAAALHRVAGRITTESLATAAAGEYTLTLTNSHIAATDMVIATVGKGTSTTGIPGLGGVTPAAGSVVITVTNLDAAAAFNGTLIVDFWVIKRL